jgi:putative peptidoglycan lipid II flippase
VTAPPSAPSPAAGTRQTVPGAAAPAGRGVHDPGRPDGGDKSLLRHSGVMAAGTLASRITGFIRTAVLLYALGTKDLGDAYNVANTVPNAVYNLALGGILTSVAVPLIVSAAKKHSDRGEAYDQRIFTLGVLVLGGITLLATAAAVPITAVYGHGMPNAATYHLTVLFSFFFLPQIFFYGVSSLAGAILNARGSFAAPMWTPIVNNVVVAAAAVGFILVAGLNRSPGNISLGDIQLLGIGTTLGIVAQTAALVPSLRKVGFRWRPRFDFRRAEVSQLGRMSGWMLGYIVTTQVSFLVTTVVSNDAGARVCATCAGAGFAAFSNAWQLFQLPYAIVGMSVITAMLPRMSAHAAEGDNELVTSDYSTATRLASVIIVPSALILAVLGPALAQGVFGHGSTSASSARYLGLVFAVFSLGLLPYTIFNLQMRVFYAMHDNRTPALIGGVAMAVRIASSLAALALLPPQYVVAGLGIGFGLSNLVTAMALGRVLSKRVGGLDSKRIRSSMLRMHVAAVPGVLVALAVALGVSAVTSSGTAASLATVIIGGGGGLAAYLLAARLLKIGELRDLTALLRSRLPGRAG